LPALAFSSSIPFSRSANGRDGVSTVLDALTGHAPATGKRYLCPAAAATSGPDNGLLASGEGSSERFANLQTVPEPVKPAFGGFGSVFTVQSALWRV
jgi:hypothetical protein